MSFDCLWYDDCMDPKTQQPQNNQQPVQRQPLPAAPQQQGVVGGPKEMPKVGSEWVAPSVPEVILPQEVKTAGVEAHPSVPQVGPQAAQAGVQHAKEATPVESVKVEALGMKTPRSVLSHMKAMHKSVKDSLSWLVRLVIKEQDKKEKGGGV